MRKGFTLLEVIVAFAILGLALVAVADMNSGAVKMHAYAKQLSAATLLARGKMLDVEQKLLAEGPPADDTQLDGDFSDDGFPSFTWRAEIVRPKTENISPQAIIGLLTGSMGDNGGGNGSSGSSSGGAGGMAGLLGSLFGGMPNAAGSNPTPSAGAPNPTSGMAGGMGGLLQGAMNMQAQTFIDSIGKMLREVRVTVYWPNGDETEKLTVVTHMVLTGTGADVNSVQRAGAMGSGVQSLPQGNLNPQMQNMLNSMTGN